MSSNYLSILQKGVQYWNSWRKKNPSVEIDFSDLQLADQSIVGDSLWDYANMNIDLSHINFTNVNLSGANLEGANLSNGRLESANLSYCNLWDVKFVNADLRYANIKGANLVDADLKNASVYGIKFDQSKMAGKYRGIKVKEVNNNDFFRDAAMDQAYVDSLKRKVPRPVFWAWGFFTDYGRSLKRTGITALSCVAIFAAIYYLDFYCWHLLIQYKGNPSFLTPLYFSFVVFLALGSDATPIGPLGELVIVLELVMGYLALCLLVTVLAKKFLPRP
jgi:hypothetical protein